MAKKPLQQASTKTNRSCSLDCVAVTHSGRAGLTPRQDALAATDRAPRACLLLRTPLRASCSVPLVGDSQHGEGKKIKKKDAPLSTSSSGFGMGTPATATEPGATRAGRVCVPFPAHPSGSLGSALGAGPSHSRQQRLSHPCRRAGADDGTGEWEDTAELQRVTDLSSCPCIRCSLAVFSFHRSYGARHWGRSRRGGSAVHSSHRLPRQPGQTKAGCPLQGSKGRASVGAMGSGRCLARARQPLPTTRTPRARCCLPAETPARASRCRPHSRDEDRGLTTSASPSLSSLSVLPSLRPSKSVLHLRYPCFPPPAALLSAPLSRLSAWCDRCGAIPPCQHGELIERRRC